MVDRNDQRTAGWLLFGRLAECVARIAAALLDE
jgi:hypothetical protein